MRKIFLNLECFSESPNFIVSLFQATKSLFKNDIEQHLLNFDSFKFEYKIDPHCFPSIVSLGPLEFETVTINRKYQHEEFECGLNQTKTIFLFTECCSSSNTSHCPGCDQCLCSGCRLKNCIGLDSELKSKVNM